MWPAMWSTRSSPESTPSSGCNQKYRASWACRARRTRVSASGTILEDRFGIPKGAGTMTSKEIIVRGILRDGKTLILTEDTQLPDHLPDVPVQVRVELLCRPGVIRNG